MAGVLPIPRHCPGTPDVRTPLRHGASLAAAGCPRAVELLLDSGARYVVSRGLPSPLMAALQPEMGEEGEFVPATEQRLACARLLLKRWGQRAATLRGGRPGAALTACSQANVPQAQQ